MSGEVKQFPAVPVNNNPVPVNDNLDPLWPGLSIAGEKRVLKVSILAVAALAIFGVAFHCYLGVTTSDSLMYLLAAMSAAGGGAAVAALTFMLQTVGRRFD